VKKNTVKKLELAKETLSNLETKFVSGGATYVFSCRCVTANC
jgi:hypothetical protein